MGYTQLLTCFLLPFLVYTSSSKNVLDLEIDNLTESKQSILQIAFFENPEDFPDYPMKSVSVEIKKQSRITYTIEGLNEGEYFIAVYQDLDLNEKLDKNLIGIPIEPYGFSNNIKPGITGLNISEGFFKFPENQKLSIALRN